MKNLLRFIAPIALLAVVSGAEARDDILSFSIQDALASDQAKAILGTNVQFYFGDVQPKAKIKRTIGEYRENRKTNGVGKSDLEACNWVFLSTLKALRDRAKQVGGNAIVNIQSNYKNNLTSSNDTFQCGAGGLMSGVALQGDIVVLE